ncbi:hypothetical protein GCM10009710_08200 [Aeromicrobium alkaliterrae]|uniref:Uncharacterized protein n=1 Tax=Aeromicrobium alkaliterrae TaxID=302168 RepID=A0ABP4VRD7_9ACTN
MLVERGGEPADLSGHAGAEVDDETFRALLQVDVGRAHDGSGSCSWDKGLSHAGHHAEKA